MTEYHSFMLWWIICGVIHKSFINTYHVSALGDHPVCSTNVHAYNQYVTCGASSLVSPPILYPLHGEANSGHQEALPLTSSLFRSSH